MKRNNYWNVALSGVFFLGMSVGAVAQSPASPAPSPSQSAPQQPAQSAPQARPQMTMDQRMARLTQMLNLSVSQQAQIRPILEQANAKMQALAADTATPMADRQAKAATIRESVQSQMEAVLTPEQKQRIQAMSQRGPGGPGTPPAQPPAQPQPQR